MNLQYLQDADVSVELDKKIRTLLSSCFIKGQDAEIFSRQRYYNEMPEHIPKLLEDADSEARSDVRTRRNMKRMVIPFSSVVTQ